MQDKSCHLFAGEMETEVDDWVSAIRKVLIDDNTSVVSLGANDRNRDKGAISLSPLMLSSMYEL